MTCIIKQEPFPFQDDLHLDTPFHEQVIVPAIKKESLLSPTVWSLFPSSTQMNNNNAMKSHSTTTESNDELNLIIHICNELLREMDWGDEIHFKQEDQVKQILTLPTLEPESAGYTGRKLFCDQLKSHRRRRKPGLLLKSADEERNGICLESTCMISVNYRGLCKNHGRVRKCQIRGCPRKSQGKNLCITHGGGKRCCTPLCTNASQSNGHCKAHGGGLRCSVATCHKSSQGGGLCRKHGGGRRCASLGCSNGAQIGNFCARHGGFRQCKIAMCTNVERGAGFCTDHRKQNICLYKGGCKRIQKEQQLCATHLRLEYSKL